MPGRLLEPSTFRCRTKSVVFAAMIPARIKIYPSLNSALEDYTNVQRLTIFYCSLHGEPPGTRGVKLRYCSTYTK